MADPFVRPLVLASASPRRAELLRHAGFDFTIDAADVDETVRLGESAEAYVLRVARDKARTVWGRRKDSAIVAADTTVVANGAILGKPADEADAARMLQLLAGATHDVFTAVVVRCADREIDAVERTEVEMSPLAPDEIKWYVATGEPMGKAGAYGIQGCAARYIERIDGSWSNVVGLPVATLYRLLKSLGA